MKIKLFGRIRVIEANNFDLERSCLLCYFSRDRTDMKFYYAPCLLLILAAFTINAQSAAIIAGRTIPLGDATGAIGTLGPDSEDWRPLFFAVDKDNNIYIPDYYKNRIAVYRSNGSFDRGIEVEAGISPRMNFFGRGPDGAFVAFNDSVLFCLEPNGKIRWNAPFPMGSLPSAIVLTDQGIFVRIADYEDKGALQLPWKPPFTANTASKTVGAKLFPVILSGSQAFGFDLASMRKLDPDPNRWKEGDDSSIPLLISGDGTSYWLDSENGKRVIGYDKKGIFKIDVFLTEVPADTWVWISIRMTTSGFEILYNEFTEKAIVIKTIKVK
jgi:hypothetical protein